MSATTIFDVVGKSSRSFARVLLSVLLLVAVASNAFGMTGAGPMPADLMAVAMFSDIDQNDQSQHRVLHQGDSVEQCQEMTQTHCGSTFYLPAVFSFQSSQLNGVWTDQNHFARTLDTGPPSYPPIYSL